MADRKAAVAPRGAGDAGDPTTPETAPGARAGTAPAADATPVGDATPADLAELFVRLAKRLRRGSSRGLAPLGLTPSQARALRTIAHARHPLPIGQLAARLDIVPRSATGVVDALEASGLVARERDPGDRRSTLVGLTDEGRHALRRMREVWRHGIEDLFVPLSPPDRAELQRLLTILDDALPAPDCEHHRAPHRSLDGPRRDR